MLRRATFSLCTCILLLGFAASPAFAATTWSTYYKRGALSMWSKDSVTWTTSSGRLTQSALTQTCGALFPNTITTRGKTLYKYSSSRWRYTSTYRGGAGLNTSWGPWNLYAYDSNDYLNIYGNGSITATHD